MRKRLARLAPTERVSATLNKGLYTPEANELAYAGLLDRARPILEFGRIAILDATFGQCRHRAMAAELARELRVSIHIDVADWRDAIHEFAREIA